MAVGRCSSCGRTRELDPRYSWGHCLDWAECVAFRNERSAKGRLRASVPPDAELRELHLDGAGTCKWCGGRIYRRNKAGQIVVSGMRMWHDGREVDPRAHPEPNCLAEYYREYPKDFRTAVFARDTGVCASCGLDVPKAEEEAHAARGAAFTEHYERWRGQPWSEEQSREYRAITSKPIPNWHADHVVPLADGGGHLMANAQTLCDACHMAKTAQENRDRAQARRGQGALL